MATDRGRRFSLAEFIKTERVKRNENEVEDITITKDTKNETKDDDMKSEKSMSHVSTINEDSTFSERENSALYPVRVRRDQTRHRRNSKWYDASHKSVIQDVVDRELCGLAPEDANGDQPMSTTQRGYAKRRRFSVIQDNEGSSTTMADKLRALEEEGGAQNSRSLKSGRSRRTSRSTRTLNSIPSSPYSRSRSGSMNYGLQHKSASKLSRASQEEITTQKDIGLLKPANEKGKGMNFTDNHVVRVEIKRGKYEKQHNHCIILQLGDPVQEKKDKEFDSVRSEPNQQSLSAGASSAFNKHDNNKQLLPKTPINQHSSESFVLSENIDNEIEGNRNHDDQRSEPDKLSLSIGSNFAVEKFGHNQESNITQDSKIQTLPSVKSNSSENIAYSERIDNTVERNKEHDDKGDQTSISVSPNSISEKHGHNGWSTKTEMDKIATSDSAGRVAFSRNTNDKVEKNQDHDDIQRKRISEITFSTQSPRNADGTDTEDNHSHAVTKILSFEKPLDLHLIDENCTAKRQRVVDPISDKNKNPEDASNGHKGMKITDAEGGKNTVTKDSTNLTYTPLISISSKDVAGKSGEHGKNLEDGKVVDYSKDVKDGNGGENGKDVVKSKDVKHGKNVKVKDVENDKDVEDGKDVEDDKNVKDGKDMEDCKHLKDGKDVEEGKDVDDSKDVKDGNDVEDNKDAKDVDDSKDLKDSKDVEHGKDVKDGKDVGDNKYLKVGKDVEDGKDMQGGKNTKDGEDVEYGKDVQDDKDLKDDNYVDNIKDVEDKKGQENSKGVKDVKDNKDVEDDKNVEDGKDVEVDKSMEDIKDMEDSKDVVNSKSVEGEMDVKDSKDVEYGKDVEDTKGNIGEEITSSVGLQKSEAGQMDVIEPTNKQMANEQAEIQPRNNDTQLKENEMNANYSKTDSKVNSNNDNTSEEPRHQMLEYLQANTTDNSSSSRMSRSSNGDFRILAENIKLLMKEEQEHSDSLVRSLQDVRVHNSKLYKNPELRQFTEAAVIERWLKSQDHHQAQKAKLRQVQEGSRKTPSYLRGTSAENNTDRGNNGKKDSAKHTGKGLAENDETQLEHKGYEEAMIKEDFDIIIENECKDRDEKCINRVDKKICERELLRKTSNNSITKDRLQSQSCEFESENENLDNNIDTTLTRTENLAINKIQVCAKPQSEYTDNNKSGNHDDDLNKRRYMVSDENEETGRREMGYIQNNTQNGGSPTAENNERGVDKSEEMIATQDIAHSGKERELLKKSRLLRDGVQQYNVTDEYHSEDQETSEDTKIINQELETERQNSNTLCHNENQHAEQDCEEVLAPVVHCTSSLYTKTPTEETEEHYIGHHNVSASLKDNPGVLGGPNKGTIEPIYPKNGDKSMKTSPKRIEILIKDEERNQENDLTLVIELPQNGGNMSEMREQSCQTDRDTDKKLYGAGRTELPPLKCEPPLIQRKERSFVRLCHEPVKEDPEVLYFIKQAELRQRFKLDELMRGLYKMKHTDIRTPSQMSYPDYGYPGARASHPRFFYGYNSDQVQFESVVMKAANFDDNVRRFLGYTKRKDRFQTVEHSKKYKAYIDLRKKLKHLY